MPAEGLLTEAVLKHACVLLEKSSDADLPPDVRFA